MITRTPVKANGTLDYDPFGMLLVGRNWDVESEYRYGFNGKEKDEEIVGNYNALDFGARIYDSRIGRFLSIDTYSSLKSGLNPYIFASDCPISAIDVNGDSTVYVSISGAVLLVTMDRQPNAIVVIENVNKFKRALHRIVKLDGYNAIDGDVSNASLRRLGKNYMFDKLFEFDDKYKSYRGEASTGLVETKGSTNTNYDSQITEYTPSLEKDHIDVTDFGRCLIKWRQFPTSPGLHLHPTYNDGLVPGPSGTNNIDDNTDMELHNNNTNGTFQVVVDLESNDGDGGSKADRSIYFYNYNGKYTGDSFKIDRDVYSFQKNKTAMHRYIETL